MSLYDKDDDGPQVRAGRRLARESNEEVRFPRPFVLTRAKDYKFRGAPSHAEGMAIALLDTGERMEEQENEDGSWMEQAACFYELAADAYIIAGSNSIGHNRRERYDAAARELELRARALRVRLTTFWAKERVK